MNFHLTHHRNSVVLLVQESDVSRHVLLLQQKCQKVRLNIALQRNVLLHVVRSHDDVAVPRVRLQGTREFGRLRQVLAPQENTLAAVCFLL